MKLRSSPQERRQLTAALAHVPRLRDRADRDEVIDGLERRLGQSLDLTRDADDSRDIANLADLCLRHPEFLHPLLEELSAAGSSPELAELTQMVDLVLPTMLSFTERRELLSLMAGIPEKELARLYAAAVGPFAPPPTDPVKAPSLLYDLEDTISAPGTLPPLLLFADLLSGRPNRAAARALREWTNAVAARLDCAPQLAAARRAAEPPTIAERHFLIVELVPDALSDDMFMLRAWLQDSSGPRLALISYDEPKRISEVAGLVRNLLNRIAAMADDLTIEFIIPYTLLDYPFERLTIDSGQLPIGAMFSVVVRSLERLYSRPAHQWWQSKWAQLQLGSGTGSVLWLERPGETSRDVLLRRLADDTLCMVQAYRPRGDHEEMRAAVLSGIPAIVWNRDGLRPADFAHQVRTELLRDGPVGLPGRVRRVRQEAVHSAAPPGHLGSCVALLWDDADRLPEPQMQLRAPDNRMEGDEHD